MDTKAIPIVGIPGSLRQGSYTRIAVGIALRGAELAGAETLLIDLRDYDLLFCDGQADQSRYHAGLLELRKQVTRARGIILGTPEYHGSFSGVLKNALDLMGFPEFEGKIIGLVGVSGGTTDAHQTLCDLQRVTRMLHAWVVPTQASISEVEKMFDENGTVRDSNVEKELMDVGRQVAQYAEMRTGGNFEKFLMSWESAPVNPWGDNDVRPIRKKD
jgi:FMN reductase